MSENSKAILYFQKCLCKKKNDKDGLFVFWNDVEKYLDIANITQLLQMLDIKTLGGDVREQGEMKQYPNSPLFLWNL